MPLRAAALPLTLLALALTACQRADEQAADTNSTTLTVYSSLPLQGPAGRSSQAVANGERLALRQAGGRVGGLTVKLSVLDDSTPASERWDARQTADNARTAVRDKTAIAYLGDGDSGATAISLPVLNEAGILQVSPTSTYAGLTRREDADKGEPEKYYPAGVRTFARTVPSDRLQSVALVGLMRRLGCGAVEVLDDRDVYGRGLAATVQRDARAAGLGVTGRESLRPDTDVVQEAAGTAEREADCVLFAGTPAPWVEQLFDALHAADGSLQLFGGDGLATDGFAASLDPGTQARTYLTTQTTAPPTPGSPAARFERDYRRAFGEAPVMGAAQGYEAMRLVLAAIARAGGAGSNRTAVTRALFALGERSGPLGRFRIDRHGDPTLNRFAEATVRDGRVVVGRTVAVR